MNIRQLAHLQNYCRVSASGIIKCLSPQIKFVSRHLILFCAKYISFAVYLSLRFLLRYRQDLIYANLMACFPDKSQTELKRLTNSYYRHMADLLIEPFLFYLAPASLRKSLATYTNPEMLKDYFCKGKKVVLFASHYGNWEYLINLPEVTSYPVYTAFSPIKVAWINRLMIRLRSLFGVNLISKTNFYRTAIAVFVKQSLPKLLVIIGDQRPAPGNHKFYLPFLDQLTAVQTGGERIAALSGASLIYVHSNKTAQFSYEFTFAEMDVADSSAPMSVTSSYFRNLEQSIFAAPAYWLWSHNRWKVCAPTERI